MTRVVWGDVGDRVFETGVDRGMLYYNNVDGVPWNGLTAVTEAPDGAAVTAYWLDGVKFLEACSGEDYRATLQAYTYPHEFEANDGVSMVRQGMFATAQPRKTFGLSYRSKVGNDVDGVDHGYKLHVVYNVRAGATGVGHTTIAESVTANDFSWTLTATPVPIQGKKPTAHFIFDSRYTLPERLEALENRLYGNDDQEPRLPSIDEIYELFQAPVSLLVVDNGDGVVHRHRSG